jgi:penicillin-binding protein 1A
MESPPQRTEAGAERAIDERNAFIMTSIMQDVVRMGTGARAMQLGRQDLAGKTGTTNDFIDAWFCGYNTQLVAVAWIGFDNPHTLGSGETGAQAALPMWMSYMGKVLKNVPETPRAVPEGVVTLRVNPATGLREPDGKSGVIEYFFQEYVPAEHDASATGEAPADGAPTRPEDVRNQLF